MKLFFRTIRRDVIPVQVAPCHVILPMIKDDIENRIED
jgi:hypothetical protein